MKAEFTKAEVFDSSTPLAEPEEDGEKALLGRRSKVVQKKGPGGLSILLVVSLTYAALVALYFVALLLL